MRKTNLLITLVATLTLSMAALTACTVAEASTHAATTEAIKTEATTTTAGENTHAPSNRLEDILQRGYIEIATEPYFAPNEFIDPTITGEDNIVGSDIELAKFIANDLGVELRLKPMDFTSVLGSMTSGKFDMAISALAYTPSRAETMNLSKGYYYGSEDPQKAYGILIRAEDADEIKTIEDLADKTVAAQNGSLQEMFVREQIPAYKQYNQVSSTNDAFLMVQTGRADAMAAALKMAELYLESNPECGLMILPDFYFTVDLDTQGTRIGLPLGEDELTDRVNEIIDKVLEQDLYNQWYEEYKEYAKKLGLEG
ncbi:MAG: transporter substrate-binding domain-containing protein [Lachnospiraceae bacterium]|nr:transporter substrate-binding domain-containing protein [Lachnospiraceae bacterium]MBQ5660076.1 transporter substrate-binding domain-containing protein [Lachnospiraceae bacterium]